MAKEKGSETDRSVQAVKRTLSILDAFITKPNGLSLGDLAGVTGLFKSVILRYMLTLEVEQYVRKRSDGNYELGPRAYQLGAAYERSFNLRQYVIPVLEKLTAHTQESSTFYVRAGNLRMCLFRVDSPQHLKSSVPVGTMLPMDDTPSACVLRAFSNEDLFDQDIASQMISSTQAGENRYQPSGIITSSVSAPVLMHGNSLVGVLSISGPEVRFNPDEPSTQNLLIEMATLLSRQLGANI